MMGKLKQLDFAFCIPFLEKFMALLLAMRWRMVFFGQ